MFFICILLFMSLFESVDLSVLSEIPLTTFLLNITSIIGFIHAANVTLVYLSGFVAKHFTGATRSPAPTPAPARDPPDVANAPSSITSDRVDQMEAHAGFPDVVVNVRDLDDLLSWAQQVEHENHLLTRILLLLDSENRQLKGDRSSLEGLYERAKSKIATLRGEIIQLATNSQSVIRGLENEKANLTRNLQHANRYNRFSHQRTDHLVSEVAALKAKLVFAQNDLAASEARERDNEAEMRAIEAERAAWAAERSVRNCADLDRDRVIKDLEDKVELRDRVTTDLRAKLKTARTQNIELTAKMLQSMHENLHPLKTCPSSKPRLHVL